MKTVREPQVYLPRGRWPEKTWYRPIGSTREAWMQSPEEEEQAGQGWSTRALGHQPLGLCQEDGEGPSSQTEELKLYPEALKSFKKEVKRCPVCLRKKVCEQLNQR
jgi:hypothetical protein